jgi:hypothetical protein
MDSGERLATVEANQKNLFHRLYGNGGTYHGDIPHMLDKLDALSKAHWMLLGMGAIVTILVPVIIMYIEHYWHQTP